MNNCTHETACWLPPDFYPDRFRCNQCGYQSETLEQMAEDGISNRERLEDRCGLCGMVEPHTCQVDLNRQMAESYDAALVFAERLRSGK